jgi:subtilisin family serine protease
MPEWQLPGDITMRSIPKALSEVVDWGATWMGVDRLWARSEGAGIKVAVLDTGVDAGHPDLEGAIVDAADFTGSRWGFDDRQGHGTWCAGYIAAKRGNSIGVVGVAPRSLLLVGKVLGDNGSGSDRAIEAGIRWADKRGADIISMSLGGPAAMPNVLGAIRDFLIAKPARCVVCAAGNDGHDRDTVGYPARYGDTVSVAALDKNGNLTSFSSYNNDVTIAGPGLEMLSCLPRSLGSYGLMSGTSMATPAVAGVLALALSKHRDNPGMTPMDTPDAIKKHLAETAKKVNGIPVIAPESLIGEPTVAPVLGAFDGYVVAILGKLGYKVAIPAVRGDLFSVKR